MTWNWWSNFFNAIKMKLFIRDLVFHVREYMTWMNWLMWKTISEVCNSRITFLTHVSGFSLVNFYLALDLCKSPRGTLSTPKRHILYFVPPHNAILCCFSIEIHINPFIIVDAMPRQQILTCAMRFQLLKTRSVDEQNIEYIFKSIANIRKFFFKPLFT